MGATVDLGSATATPKESIRVLGLYFDGKLRWGPHIKEVKAKMTSQCLALTMTAASTWGATLNKARQVYSSVVRPAMTYAATAWHAPKGLREAKQTHIKKLDSIQNGCLRRVLGAYRATATRVVEAETGVPPLQTTLDQAVLRNQALRGIHPVTKIGNAQIRRKLKGRRGRKREALPTPTEEKELWALRALRLDDWDTMKKQNGERRTLKIKKATKEWCSSAWSTLWTKYQIGIPESQRAPAQEGDLGTERRALHTGLAKAESSVLTQMRTGKIGLAHFLYTCRVPEILTAGCECGWRKQDVRHVLMFCPRFADRRQALIDAAGTNDLHRMLTTPKGAKVATKWLILTGLLGQFSLASEQLYGRVQERGQKDSTPKHTTPAPNSFSSQCGDIVMRSKVTIGRDSKSFYPDAI